MVILICMVSNLKNTEENLLTKTEFVNEVAKRSGLSAYAVEEIYNVSSNLIIEKMIRDEDVVLPKLGTFSMHKKNAKNLFGNSDNKSKICLYPTFKICNSVKTRVKNGSKYTTNI